jgi:type II secretory pathway pseudopilin PulG
MYIVNSQKKNERSSPFLHTSFFHSRGFTIVEIVLALTILVLLSTVILASVRSYVREQALTGAVSSVAAVIADARNRTLSSRDALQYGVHIQDDAVTLFSGTTYSDGASGNEEILLDGNVTISDISLSGGGDDVLFERLTGDTNDAGTITLELLSDASRQKTIIIQSTGLISYN